MAPSPSLAKPVFTIVMALLLAASPFAMGAPGGQPGAPDGQGGDNGPAREAVDIAFNLMGTATRTNGGPDDSFTFYVNATGEGVRKTPNGNGVQIRADGIDANVIVVDANGSEVENYTAVLRFHAQQASHLAQGLDGFRFNMQLTGDRRESVTGNSANPDGRVLAMNAHGTTVGEADEDGAFLVEGRGQTTTKPEGNGNGATHYNFMLGGTGSIQSQDDGDAEESAAASVPTALSLPASGPSGLAAPESLVPSIDEDLSDLSLDAVESGTVLGALSG